MPDIIAPDFTQSITKDNGKMFDDFSDWTVLISNAINFQAIAEGSGSPEGVLEADVTKRYMDTAGTAGIIFYIKRDAAIAGDKTKGWILT